MLQTAKYQLNQREKSDRILMADSSQNFEKIDKVMRNTVVLELLNLCTQSDTAKIDLGLSKIESESFQELPIYIHIAFSPATTATPLSVRLNDLTSSYLGNSTSASYGTTAP